MSNFNPQLVMIMMAMVLMMIMKVVLMMRVMKKWMSMAYQLALGFFLQHLKDSGMRRAHVDQIVGPHAVEEVFEVSRNGD